MVRKWLHNYRQTHPPVHPILRKQHYVNKLSSITNQLVQTCTNTTDSVDNFLNTIDSELAESRKAMRLDTQDNIIHSIPFLVYFLLARMN